MLSWSVTASGAVTGTDILGEDAERRGALGRGCGPVDEPRGEAAASDAAGATDPVAEFAAREHAAQER